MSVLLKSNVMKVRRLQSITTQTHSHLDYSRLPAHYRTAFVDVVCSLITSLVFVVIFSSALS